MARYQYETSPRKLEPEYAPRKKKKVATGKKEEVRKQIQKQAKEKVKAKKETQRKKRKVILYVMVAFGILLAISYRNSLINENFAKVKNLKSELATIEKENQQIQVSIESSLNLYNIEQAAKERLGMQNLTNEQKVYINLPKKDYVEPAAEEVQIQEQQTWFQKALDMLKGK